MFTMGPENINYDDVTGEPINMQSYYDHIPVRGSPGRSGPVKAIHDLPVMFPDSDSGFGSGVRGRTRHYSSEDFNPTSPRLRRSASLSRLNGCISEPSSRSTSPQHFSFDGSMRSLQESLQDSEHRRSLLMHKLKEAQDTLQMQNDRLNKIETAAKDNGFIVEDLKCKEREYRRTISSLQQYEDDNERLRNDNLRLRQEMQDRIDTLDFQLKSLQNQHLNTTNENDKRTSLLDQTTTALSLLEEENCNLQRNRDTLQQEVDILRETLNLTNSKHAPIDDENKILKTDVNRLTQENTILSKKIHEMAGQMVELRNLLHAVKDENERVTINWKNISEDSSRSSKQVENYQTTISDLRSRLHTVTADKDRLFQEKLESNHKIQQLMLVKEELLKHKEVLEEQVTEQHTQFSKSHSSGSQKYEELRNMEDELNAVKKVCEELSTELASVKAYYDRAVEQINMLENCRGLLQQQLDLTQQEKHRLQIEIDRLSQMLDGRSREDKRELDMLEENYIRLKNDYKEIKLDKSNVEDRNRELETKLKKANNDIKDTTKQHKGEMETWKGTCDRLSSSLTNKEEELQNLTDKSHKLENMIRRLKEELRDSNQRCEEFSERQEDTERMRTENRRLLQEKAENEQMMKLLETQKEVLTKSSESSFNKLHDVDHLTSKVDQLRNENDLLRERVLEVEKVRDNVIKQKEELLANSDLIYKRPGLDLLEEKVELLTDANSRLAETNSFLNRKLETVDKENMKLKQVIEDGHGEPAMKDELERTRRQHCNLQDEFDQLLQDFNKLEEDNQKLTQELRQAKNSGINNEDLKRLKKERDAFQKQVQFVSGQLSLAEGSKKRANEEMNKMKKEMEVLQHQIIVSKSQSAPSPNKVVERLNAQIKKLQSEINNSKEIQHKQELTINKLNEKSLEDVGSELSQMKEELHSLMEEIDSKDQTIVFLEKELKESNEDFQQKESETEDLKNKLKQATEKKVSSPSIIPRLIVNNGTENLCTSSPSETDSLSGSLKEELEGTLKHRMGGQTSLKSRPAESLFTKKTLSKLRATPLPWSGGKTPDSSPEPTKLDSSGEGNERLQSLISKYRSYNEPAGHSSLKHIRPFTYTAPTSKSSSLDYPSAKSPEVAFKDEKSGKRSPIPPPVSPKPILKNPIKTSDTLVPDATNQNTADLQEQKDINTLIQNCQKAHLSYLLELGPRQNVFHQIKHIDTSEFLTCDVENIDDIVDTTDKSKELSAHCHRYDDVQL